VTGILPQHYLWLPIALALISATLILLWLLSHTRLLQSSQSDLVSVTSDSSQLAHLASGESSLSPVFTPEVLSWSSEIIRWAETFDLDPNLVATVMQIESCGHPTVVSPSGAIGLFQVMPFHFQAGEDPSDPEINAMRGMSYLARGFGLSGGRMDLALAGYNGGHGVIGLDRIQWPSETQRYVVWGDGILSDIASSNAQSPTLQAWLQAGGARLCRKASNAIASLPLASNP
jgi:soluble lytic murein transglycosylase-like protein